MGFQGCTHILVRVDKLLILIVMAVAVVVAVKVRGDAAKSRKEVLARLATEREERGGIDYSPTAELFREVGVRHDPEKPLPRHVPAGFPPPPPVGSAVTAAAPDHVDFPRLGDLPDFAATPPSPQPQSPASASQPTEPSDLRSMFKGISMPAGLRPLGPLAPDSASFVTDATPALVHAGLEAEFERLDCVTRWIEPTVAQTERHGMKGLVTIYPSPLAALDLDGQPLFPGVEPGHVVVRMLAL